MIPFVQKRRQGYFFCNTLYVLLLPVAFILGMKPAQGQLSLYFNIEHVQCASSATGVVEAVVGGGTRPYSYAWSTGETSSIIRRLRPGDYTVTVTDAIGNKAISTATVTGQPPIFVDISSSQACSGPATVTASATGGTPPYKYAWDMGTNNPTAVINSTGKFCVTVTDAKLCGRIECINISIDPLSVILVPTGVTCPDGTNGSVTSLVSGGTAPYTYQWSNGTTNANLSGVAGGTYQLTVTDAIGCSVTSTAIVSAPAPFAAVINAVNPSCAGTSNGSIQVVSVSGGKGPYQLSWNIGLTQSTVAGLPSGAYSLTIKDALNCTTVRDITLSPRSNLQVSAAITNETCPGSNNGIMTVVAQSGVTPYTYAWSPGGSASATRTNLIPGNYNVTVTDGAGCQRSTSGTIAAAIPFTLTLQKTNQTSCNQNNGSATAVVSGGVGPFSYLWNNGTRSATNYNLSAGVYAVTVSDAAGCSQSQTIQVLGPPALSAQVTATTRLCAGDRTGTASATTTGGTAPFSYLWNNGASTQSLSGLAAGAYQVTISDLNGCVATASATIIQTSKPEATLVTSGQVCGGVNSGTASVSVSGGTAPVSFLWSTGNTGSVLNNLSTGTYSVTVTDAFNCRDTAQGSVEIIPLMTLTGNTTNVTCNGAATGILQISVSGGKPGYTYRWNTGSTLSQVSGVPAGNYSVTVTDAAGCTASTTLTISQPTAITLTMTKSDVLCEDITTSSARVSASGGVGSFQFLWNNGSTSANQTGISAGTYTVTATDANGCTQTGSVQVLSPAAPTCLVTVNNAPSNPLAHDGSATVTVVGGVAPFAYLWGNGETTATATTLASGEFSVTTRDANGCVTSCGVSVIINTSLIGDCVWFDANQNGIQDTGENGVPNIPIILTPIGQIANFPEPKTTKTNAKGKYEFTVPPGDYKITFVIPDTMQLTLDHVPGSDQKDSDADRNTFMTPIFRVNAGTVDLSWDAGLVPPSRLIPSSGCICLNNSTNGGDGQFSETLVLHAIPGENWRIAQQSGMYLSSSPAPPAIPFSLPIGTIIPETAPGIYQLNFRHIDAEGYIVRVTNGLDTHTLQNTCYYPSVVYNNLPNVYCYNDPPRLLNLQSSVPGKVTATLNNTTITSIQPQLLAPGTYQLKLQIAPTDPAECNAIEIFPFQVKADASCLVKIGDYAWYDANSNGVQDAGESPIANVTVYLRDPARPGINLDTAWTDSKGLYCFYVYPGNYQLYFVPPTSSRYEPTAANAGTNDAKDNDVDPATSLTGTYTVVAGVNNLTIDAGFVIACDNVTDPGLIGSNQSLCGPGLDPAPIQNLRTPSGGSGELEYVWMYSSQTGSFDPTLFYPIANSNSPTYDPGPLERTTYFVRCVRRVGCSLFIEPKAVTITVENNALATVAVSQNYCLDNPINTKVDTKTDNPLVKWELWSSQVVLTPTVAFGKVATFIAANPGVVLLKVTVTENGCTLVREKTFNVTTSPTYCTSTNSALQVNGLMDENHQVNLRWRTRNDVLDYTFQVEHAVDALNWKPIASIDSSFAQEGEFKYYEYSDHAMNNGRNYYRVVGDDGFGNKFTSNTISLAARMDESSMAFAYPNPVAEQLTVDLLRDLKENESARFELFQLDGTLLRSWALEPGKMQERIDFRDMNSGLYLLRIQSPGNKPEIIKVVRE